ncbi:MAG: hypothetical protein HWQ38_27500 [Nostoc sp. NMS7]|uniref:hypothetical protein n=1 Tax=Nostoc sp. NMS7 TaxID=2815391 RepID=UPI0025DB8810|nr:hypothetical protein [Nostoc sp. NMS7]MBN3950014.1 hypothetical protein [Nostoc sp. NMS7]
MTSTISFDRVSDIYDATRGFPPGVSEQVTDFILNLVSPTAELNGELKILWVNC